MTGNDYANAMNAPASGLNPVEVFSRIGRLPIVGRAFQQRVLDEIVGDAAGAHGRVLLLSGEAGSGKSRLMSEACRFGREHGGLVLQAECLVEAGAPPYDVWIRALRMVPDATAVHLLEGSALPEGTIPYSSWRPRSMSAEETRFRLHSDVLGALEQASKHRPLLLALDDLQWADSPSLQLFRFIAQRIETLSLALIGALRSEECPPESELSRLVDDLQANQKAVRLDISAFTSEETRMLVEALLGHAAPAMAATLHERSEGNPFVLEEMIRLLASSGALSADSGSLSHGKLLIPPGVSASIRMRIDRLTAEERAMLEAGAVAGKRFGAAIVTAALQVDPERAEQSLHRLRNLSMLRYESGENLKGGSYEFIHDRFREVVLDSITPSRRKSLHLRIAGALEALPGSGYDPGLIAALANHYQMAAEPEAAASYFFRLGEVSMDRHAPDEAATAFRSAIDLRLESGANHDDLAPIELALGTALFVSGKRDAAETFSRAGEAFLHGSRLREAAVAIDQQGLALAANEQHEAALAAFQRAFDVLSSIPDRIRERASVLLHMSDTLGPSLARYDEALRAQRQAMSLLNPGQADDPLRSVASLALGRTLTRMNRLADAQEVLEQALPPTIRLGELSIAADLEGARANVTYWRGDVRQSRSCTLQRLAYAQSAGDLLNTRHISSWLAHLEVALGNWAEAERLLDEAERDVSGFDSPEPLAFTQQIRGHLAYMRGDYASACERMLDALNAFRHMGTATMLWYIGYAARASHAAGKSETSAELASEAWLLLDEMPVNALPNAATLTSLSLLAIESSRHEHCPSMYEALLPFAGQLHWTLVDRSLGMLATTMGRSALACRHFDQAITTARRHGLRLDYALAEAARSRVTGENLDQSVARLRSIGVSEAAMHAGRAEPSIRPPNPANLTDREVEVLRLVAAGMTNREIAGSLCIAEKTVTNHITHIFDKANLENRAAAAAFAVRHHLD